jgi:RNA polymerase sigma-70 factor, ECF subfamily
MCGPREPGPSPLALKNLDAALAMEPSPPASAANTDELIVRLTACQNRLYAYILSLLPDPDRARDVLQEANLVIWRKSSEYAPGTNFESWAYKIAYFEVLAERRRQLKQHRVVLLGDDLLKQLACEAEPKLATLDLRAAALEDCLGVLNARQRDQLLDRYRPGGSVKEVAARAGISQSAAGVVLHRIRKSLLDCIRRKLPQEGTP